MSSTDVMSAALKRAVTHIGGVIEACRRDGKTRLPTIKQMSTDTGFSSSTLTKAIAFFRRQDAVRVSQRSGIELTGSPVRTPLPGTADRQAKAGGKNRRERLKDQVLSDLLHGVLPPGAALPGYKELSRRYGACYASIKAVLAALVDDGKLQPYKRGYRVFVRQPPAGFDTIVYIARTRMMDFLAYMHIRCPEYWLTMEHECLRRGLQLLVVDCSEAIGSARHADTRYGTINEIQRAVPVMGYLVNKLGITDAEMEKLVADLALTGKPVSILDEVGDVPLEPFVSLVRKHGQFRFFTIANSSAAGRDAANYLLGLGHRRIACFSPVNDPWCINRTAGITDVFSEAGLRNAISHYMPDRSWLADPDNPQTIPAQYRDLVGAFQRLTSIADAVCRDDNDFFKSVRLAQYIDRVTQRTTMQEVFKRMLAGDDSTTAWVGLNDEMAMIAHRYLTLNGRRVPEDISVMGFDNSPDGFSAGLTSYSFNLPGLFLSMVDHILTPAASRKEKGAVVVEIPGVVIPRLTTAAPAAR